MGKPERQYRFAFRNTKASCNFDYNIWGDTPNTASRKESLGEPAKVNISDSTYALVKDKFTCLHRCKIEAKNKDLIDMYFVVSEG